MIYNKLNLPGENGSERPDKACSSDVVDGLMKEALKDGVGLDEKAAEAKIKERVDEKMLVLGGSDKSGRDGALKREKKRVRRNAKIGVPTATLKRGSKMLLKDQKRAPEGMRYGDLAAMRELWRKYAFKMVPQPLRGDLNAVMTILTRLDLHGADLTVIRSKNPSNVGISGTVLQETAATFKLATKPWTDSAGIEHESSIKTVCKKDTVFEANLNSLRIEIFGGNMMQRPVERGCRKPKAKPTVYF